MAVVLRVAVAVMAAAKVEVAVAPQAILGQEVIGPAQQAILQGAAAVMARLKESK